MDVSAYVDGMRRRMAARAAREEELRGQAREVAERVTAALRRLPGVRRVFLYGSPVYRHFHEQSDIDIAVEGVKAADYFALWRDLEEAMPEWAVDLRDLVPGSEFGQRVRAKGLLIYERENTGTES